jgi:transcriptional regulator with XRE-family HTH domain
MSRRKTKTPVQIALRALRTKLGLSQQSLAVAMNMSVVTVCRWETSRPPSGYSLLQLAQFAHSNGAYDIANVFEEALREEENPPDFLVIRMNEDTAEIAVSELRANSGDPVIEREYLEILRRLYRAHTILIERRLMGKAKEISYEQLNETHEDLEGDLRIAENKHTKNQG